jgi:acetylornithine aminotransferase
VTLTEPVAASAMQLAREAGFLVNAVQPDAIRIAPPLILAPEQADSYVAALPEILSDASQES